MNNFVHLHTHTSIGSMQDAMTPIDDIFKMAKKMGQTSIAITDHGTMAAVFDAHKCSKKYGIKYIPGCEIYFVNDIQNSKCKRYHLVLLAKNEVGYKNLLQINYKGYVNFQYIPVLDKVFPRVDWKILQEHKDGIICLTACGSGPLAASLFALNEDNVWDQNSCYIQTLKTANKLKELFESNLYLEVQPHNLKVYKKNRKTNEVECDSNGDAIIVVDQEYTNNKLIGISKELNIPVVATCDVHYINKEDAEIHDMLMAINAKKPFSDLNRHRYEEQEFYLKSYEDINEYFSTKFNSKLADEVCKNSVLIANRCDDSNYLEDDTIKFPKFDITIEQDYQNFLKWKKRQNRLPKYDDHAFLRYRCINSFKNKFKHLSKEQKKEYKERMIKEIKVLESRNFASYLLIVSDFIIKAKEQGIRVGPGRGSVGGSLVAYLLDIHEVDPLQYGLLFERFINIYKKAFPDIDTDFSPDGRNWVEQYIINRYGKECVAHVSNLSTMTPKVVIKDVARSLQLGGSKSDAFKIANAITDSIPKDSETFEDALRTSEKFREFCASYPELEKYGKKLVGLEKTYSTHAAGIVVSDRNLSELVPLRYDKKGTISLQYEKERCEEVGLIKMDLLGLEHLKIIDNTILNVKMLGGQCLDTPKLAPFDDKNVWDMISNGHTTCVFQMGSQHMRNLCKRIKPQSIEDLSLVNALGRPSAIKSREDYIKFRNKNIKIKYKHPCVKEALEDTLGVCVYEDQLMKFANVVAGWDLNEADGLRKLTKYKGKHPEMVKKLKDDFITGSVKHSNLTNKQALEIWEEIIEPFGGYGFNKPHGIFYSLNGYHTAYYKYHYPSAFMAAALKSEVEKSSSSEEKIKLYKKEAIRMGIKIMAPDINKSGDYFTVVDDKTIIMGLAVIKGVGIKAVKNIIETRMEHSFISFADFLYRTNSNIVNKKVIQALAKAGCFDSLNITRKSAFTYYSNIRIKANSHAKKTAITGKNTWELMKDLEFSIDHVNEEWNKKEILTAEGETLGEYISGDINDLYGGFFTNKCVSLKRLKKLADGTPIRVEVVVENITQPKIKSGKNKGKIYGNCTVMDRNKNSAIMKIWSESWKHVKDKIIAGRPIRALCRVNVYKDTHMLVLNSLEQVG